MAPAQDGTLGSYLQLVGGSSLGARIHGRKWAGALGSHYGRRQALSSCCPAAVAPGSSVWHSLIRSAPPGRYSPSQGKRPLLPSSRRSKLAHSPTVSTYTLWEANSTRSDHTSARPANSRDLLPAPLPSPPPPTPVASDRCHPSSSLPPSPRACTVDAASAASGTVLPPALLLRS